MECDFIKGIPESCLAFFPLCHNTMRRWQSATWKKDLNKTQPCWHADLDLSTFRVVRNKFPLLINHPINGPLLWQPELTESVVQLDRCGERNFNL